MKIKDAQLEDERNITEEERQSIALEMEEILASRQKITSSDTLTVSNSTKLFSFPIYVNVIIFLLLLGSVGGVYTYFAIEDKRFLNTHDTTNFSENVLARLIIDEAQKAIEEQESKIASINEQLEEERKKQSLLEKKFDEKVQVFVANAKQELNSKLDEFRKRLEGQNISATTIEKRLKEYERKLRTEQSQKLAHYKAELEAERKQEMIRFNANIKILRQQVDDRQSQLRSLEQNLNNEKAGLEQQLQQQREASSEEISKAQRQIANLKNRNAERTSAVKSISTMYNALLSSFNSGKYDNVRKSIQGVSVAIEKSAYKNDEEFVRMRNSLVSISNALASINLLQTQLSEQSKVLKGVGSTKEIEDLQTVLSSEKEKIALLEKEVATLNKDSESTKKELASREKNLQLINKRYALLENQYKAIQTEVNKNIQIIVNYLMVKKQKANTQSIASLKTLVDSLVKQDKYYGVIGAILAQALDPSGQLQF